jgi:hypothetical protein
MDGRLPNLFIVGVPRGGTTSLWWYLGRHPDIFMAEVKEPYYFSDYHKTRPRFPKDRAAYLDLFARGRENRWRGEASTAYFWDPPSAVRIQEASPEARIVISLRNPAERAYSEYLHNIETGNERRPFLPALRDLLARGAPDNPRADFLSSGFYVDGLERYLRIFGESVHVLFFEDLRRDAREEVRKIFAFLEIDPDVADRLDLRALNRSHLPRRGARRLLTSRGVRALPGPLRTRAERLLVRRSRPPMPPEARALLDEVYASERAPLEQLLQRPLPW